MVLGVSEHCIEDGEELSGTGGDGDFCGFSGVLEAFSERPEGWVVSAGDEGCEVEGAADIGAATPDVALAAMEA